MASATPPTTDPVGPDDTDAVLVALAGVVETALGSRDYLDRIISRADELRDSRARGLTYAEIVTGADGPLVIELVTDLIDNLLQTSSRLRRTEARALYAEGLTMEKIGLLLRVSHQRVSAIIRTGDSESIATAQAELTRAKALALTDAEFRMIADAWPQIVWVVGPTGWAEYVNQLGTAYAGLSVEEISGRGWAAIVHPDDRTDVLRTWEQAVVTGAPFELEYRVRRFDGQFRSHLSRCAPIKNAAGVVTKWLGIATDIEDEKNLRHDLHRAMQEAAEAHATLRALHPSDGGPDETSFKPPHDI
jgi:PAS domain S-box-containing protein